MLTIYAPLENTKSKCWEIFNGIKQSWPTEVKIKSNLENTAESPAMFWGFVNNNINLLHQLEQQGSDYWYTDTPYFGRFDNDNLKETIIIGEFVRIKYMLDTGEIVHQIDSTNLI